MLHFLLLLPLFFYSTLGDLVPNPTAPVDWTTCEGQPANSSFSCAYYDVPLDWTDPSDSRNATLYVAKYSVPKKTKGTLFVNPGGPGGSGVDFLMGEGNVDLLLALTGSLYDLVSWDPRGVGQKTFPGAAICFESDEDASKYLNNTVLADFEVRGNLTYQPDIDNMYSQVDILAELSAGLLEKCTFIPGGGQYLEYVGSVATVRDMVALVDVLDGEGAPIHFYGISYGTVLGNIAANMFPQRVGRIIIDGVISLKHYALEQPYLQWARHVESADEALQAYVVACELAGPEGCILADDSLTDGDILKWIQDLSDLAYDLHAEGQVLQGSQSVRSVIFDQLYTPRSWPVLTSILYDTWVNYTSTPPSSIPMDLSGLADFSLYAIQCGDATDPGDTTFRDVFDDLIDVTREVSGFFGPRSSQYMNCHAWPARSKERFQGPFNSTLAYPILVIGNTADPITPLKEAEAVNDEFGDSSYLITQHGAGHGSFAELSSCTLKMTAAYLINGTTPHNDATVCEILDFPIFPNDTGNGVTSGDVSSKIKELNSAAASVADNDDDDDELSKVKDERRTFMIATIALGAATVVLVLMVIGLICFRRHKKSYVKIQGHDQDQPRWADQ
ncbi:TAP-like protein-domain-containing protein [Mucidula mucida]|nr:TAP-like protein-domain-containing protein [Mucidula mucida]